MAAVLLDKADGEHRNQAQKTGAESASASLSLTTDYQTPLWSGVADLATGNNPWVSFIILWTKGTGATLTVYFEVSFNGTDWGPVPWVNSATAGVSGIQPHILTFASADYGGAATMNLPIDVRVNSFRRVRMQVKSNAASGSVIVQAGVGTGM